jgi:hypothetical protein
VNIRSIIWFVRNQKRFNGKSIHWRSSIVWSLPMSPYRATSPTKFVTLPWQTLQSWRGSKLTFTLLMLQQLKKSFGVIPLLIG